ncbi:MAG TPA: adenylate/guanylate cyclase domain-containing protein [Devosiaceae bacterium]
MGGSEQTNRRLAAILAADVVGYSRMMGSDEAGTLRALKQHREAVFDPAVARHRGRIVKLIGDGTLVEFGSVVDAVNCALDIQNAMAAQAPAKPGIVLRIGINVGDIIIDDDDIYGDGVNVAARLEPLAAPGGICVSAIVHDSVGNRIDIAFEDGGEVAVKNIANPVRVWKWRPGSEQSPNAGGKRPTDAPAEGARPRETSSPQAEQPSIAVLPFNNMSGDPEQEYFSDGITEDIITDLSKVAGLLVIARNSSFAYKGKSPDIRTVGRELGVTSVLEGSIRRAGNRVRITGQLIDARTGTHLWAERYDRDLTDIFAVQDEVTSNIVEALKVTLTPVEEARIAETPTLNPEAHDLFLRGREALLGVEKTKETFERAVRYFTRAIERDPDYAEPYAGLAHAYNHDFQNRWSGRTDSQDLSNHYARLALEKDPNLPYAHYIFALVKFWERDLAGSDEEMQKAIALNPNFAPAVGMSGVGKIYGGTPLDAIPILERALRLDPMMGHQYLHFMGSAYLVAGEYEKAVEAFSERIRLSPDTDLSRAMMIAALGHLGRVKEAQRLWRELMKINPRYSFEEHIARLPFSDPGDAERIREGVRLAGVI